jgi:hypothetical protein
MYKSPIEIITTDMMTEIKKRQDNQVYQAVLSVGVNVDKAELLQALQYDRRQYEKGYADAVEKFATILAEMLDTPCNFSPTDEWLCFLCDYCNTCDCEYKECWKQFFKHYDNRETVGDMW